MAQLPTSVEITVKIPLKTTVKTTTQNNARIFLTAETKKAYRFFRKVRKLCEKHHYHIKIEQSRAENE